MVVAMGEEGVHLPRLTGKAAAGAAAPGSDRGLVVMTELNPEGQGDLEALG